MLKAKTIGVIGIKGGVGKTSLVANLGASLAKDFNKKVLLVDANYSTPHLNYHLGLINPLTTLQKVLTDEITIEKALYKHESGFHLLPGALHQKKIDHQKLKAVLSPLKKFYDLILIDSSPSLNDEILSTFDTSDELLIISSPDYPTLSSTFHAIKLAKKKNTPIKGLVLNKIRNKKFELKELEIEGITGVEIIAAIPDDEKVLEALANSKPVVIHEPRSPAAKEFKKLASLLIAGPNAVKGPVKKDKKASKLIKITKKKKK
jgi:septum site-determining protein MinD